MGTVLAPGIVGGPLGEALADPQGLLDAPNARFVKDHRRTAVAAVSLRGCEIFVKRFKPYSWYRRVEWAASGTPARRCWHRCAELERAGFRVPRPLAFSETRRFVLPADCYFVTASIAGAQPAGRFWREHAARAPIRERTVLLRTMAAELRRFHDHGFYSRDSNADNFLVRAQSGQTAEIFFLEVENVRRPGAVSERRRMKNLVQLYRPIRGEVRRLDRVRFLRAYRGLPLRQMRAWLKKLAELDAEKEAEYRARRARLPPSA